MTELTAQENKMQQLLNEQMSVLPEPNIMRLASIERELMLVVEKTKPKKTLHAHWLYLLLGGSMAVAAVVGGYDFVEALFGAAEEEKVSTEDVIENTVIQPLNSAATQPLKNKTPNKQKAKKMEDKDASLKKETFFIYRKEEY